MRFGARREARAELILRAAAHGVAGDDVLGDGMLHEAFRRDDLDAAGGDIGRIDDAGDAAEMIGVGVRIDDGAHGTIADGAARERECCGGGFAGGEWIDDDEAGVADDDRHVRDVEPADLIDAFADLEETGAREQTRLAPEAWIYGFRDLRREEIVGGEIPSDAAIGGADLRLIPCGYEAALGEVFIFDVGPVERLRELGVGAARGVGDLGCRRC